MYLCVHGIPSNTSLHLCRVRPPVPGTVSPAGPLVRPDPSMAAVAINSSTGLQPFYFDAVLGPGAADAAVVLPSRSV